MSEMVKAALPWVLSATSAIMLWLMGNKSRLGPYVGLASQGLWMIFVVWTGQWGLLPGVLLYTVVHARNAYRWRRASKSKEVR